MWESSLTAHMRTHSEARLKCSICQASFFSAQKLDTHMTKHSNPKPHKCEQCGKEFAFAYLLDAHTRRHLHAKLTHKCEMCLEFFSSKLKLRIHNKIHKMPKTSILEKK